MGNKTMLYILKLYLLPVKWRPIKFNTELITKSFQLATQTNTVMRHLKPVCCQWNGICYFLNKFSYKKRKTMLSGVCEILLQK